MRELKAAAAAVLVLTVVFGLAYPLVMTGVSQVVFPGASNGSLVERGGRPVGSTLIGQDFSRDTGRKDADGNPVLVPDLRYFQGRPSATGYNAAGTGFNNQGANQKALADQLRGFVKDYLARERRFTPGLAAARIPADAVTSSASSIDPQISEANARIQANRVARERALPLERVLTLVGRYSSRPLFGLGGPKSVNVVELNLALDRDAR